MDNCRLPRLHNSTFRRVSVSFASGLPGSPGLTQPNITAQSPFAHKEIINHNTEEILASYS